MLAPAVERRAWVRIAPTLVISGIMAATALILLPPMYFVGKRDDDRRIFLRNYRAPNEFEAFSSYPMDYARESDEANDVIFVGDSSLRYDLQAPQFERESGLRAYNLSSVGLLAIGGFTPVVEAYLHSRHPRPRLIVLGILPAALAGGDTELLQPRGAGRQGPLPLVLRAGHGRPAAAPVVLVSRPRRLQVHVRLPGRGFRRFADEPIPFRRPSTYRSFRQEILGRRGSSAGGQRPWAAGRVGDPASTLDPFTISDQARVELDALIRLAADRDIPVLVRLTPYSGDAAEHSPTLRAWAEDLESRHSNAIVGRPELLLYDLDLFFDEAHLGHRVPRSSPRSSPRK